MEYLGYFTLGIFLIFILLALLRKLTLPIETVLVLVTLANFSIAVVYRLVTEKSFLSVKILPNELLGGIILHPVTAMLAGLFIGGVLTACGGFEALKAVIGFLNRTPLGLAGTLVIVINLPLILALPCGRIIAAALLPLLFAFGPENMGLLTKTQLIVLIGAFARNSFGSCGPSPIGGVGQIGEGFLGGAYPAAALGILRAPQAFALILGTGLAALFLKLVTVKMFPQDTKIRDKKMDINLPGRSVEPSAATPRGYAAIVIFLASLIVAVFQPFGRFPVQTTLVIGALIMMVVGRVGLKDLMAGIILMPATAMLSGFLAAGSLAATGGFVALGSIFKLLSSVPVLGVAGMLAIFIQTQTILPLPCSRILTAALVPVLYQFGPAGFGLIDNTQLAIVMAAYIINATTSCGPSPIGGAGMMAEGALRAETGYLRGAMSFASMAVMAPLAAFFMKFTTLNVFAPTENQVNLLSLIAATAVIVLANMGVIYIMGSRLRENVAVNRLVSLAGFVLVGILAGCSLNLALYGLIPLELIHGGVGGAVAAAVIALMLPIQFGRRRALAAA